MGVRKVVAVTLCLLLFATGAWAAQPEVTKYEVQVEQQDFVKYGGTFKRSFKNGFPLDVASGLTFAGRDGGDLLFWAITDQGPAAEAPAFKKSPSDKAQITRMLPAPGFSPSFSVVRVASDHAMVGRVTPIKDTAGKAVSGLPIPSANVGSKNEMPLADDLKVLTTDLQGLNPKGIDVDRKDGNLWICDGYGPFLLKLEKETGKTIQKYGPGKGLPLELNLRQMNRGFAGIATTQAGKVFAPLESVLDYDGNMQENHARFIRVYQLDEQKGDVVAFAYPHDIDSYRHSTDARIGDIAALSEKKFLLVEQGLDKNDRMRNLVYMVDLSDASGIGDKLARNGKQIEDETDVAELNKLGLYLAKKTLVCDLGALGWGGRLAGGLAIAGDDTIAVFGGNDFGMALKMTKMADGKDGRPVRDIAAYETGYDKKLHLDGKLTSATFALVPNDRAMEFWTIKLPKPLSAY